MKLLRAFLTAFANLRANKLRSALTMLGIIIGVAAVIAMVGIGDGAQQNITQRIRAMGTNLLVVSPGQHRFHGARVGRVDTLKEADAEAIGRLVPGVAAISPESSQQLQVKFLNQNTNTSVTGVRPQFLSVNSFTIKRGRFLDDDDLRHHRKVVVIGGTVEKELFGGEVPLGRKVKIKTMPFLIVGVLNAKGQMGWRDPDDQVLIPLPVAQKRLFGIDYLRSINISVLSEERMGEVQHAITALLRSRHRLKPNADADFNIRNQKEMLETFSEISETLGVLLAAIAAVSMVVGGIGIMNIMMVSVSERTREIGVRKAVGATTVDILFQFMIEAIALCVLGGLLGIAVGIATTVVISTYGAFHTVLSARAIVMAFAFALLVGVFFGIYPARRAARLNPIDALRYE